MTAKNFSATNKAKAVGLTIKKMAKMLGVDRNTLAHRSKNNPDIFDSNIERCLEIKNEDKTMINLTDKIRENQKFVFDNSKSFIDRFYDVVGSHVDLDAFYMGGGYHFVRFKNRNNGLETTWNPSVYDFDEWKKSIKDKKI